MSAPKLYINIGDEINILWQEVDSDTSIYFTGPDTTSYSKKDPITPTTLYGYKWAPELWIANSNFDNPTQCKLFQPPDSQKQYANVLRIDFENATLTPPVLTAFDNSSENSVNDQMFTGSNGTNNTPWLKAIETTGNIQPPQNWIFGIDAISNSTISNALSSTNYAVTCSSIASDNDSKTFAIACAVPSDAIQGEHNWAFSIIY